MSRLDSLAGLDSMVLHINTRSEPSPTVSTSISMDSESFILVPRKRRQLGRASRTPLADKTPDFNTNISPSLNPGVARAADFSISIYRDSLSESTPSVTASQRNHLPKFPSFKPLPLVASASPLRTSFLDLTIYSPSSPESNSEPSPQTIPSSILPQRSCTELSREPPRKIEVTPQKIHDEPYLIPAFQHPNSPYVPWAPPLRRKILRPLSPVSRASVFSSSHSRPLSHSGDRAPEEAETSEAGTRRLPLAPKGWGRLRKAVLQGVNRVAARLVILKRPLWGKRGVSPNDTENHIHSISGEDDVFSATYSASPHSLMAALSKRRVFTSSMASLASSDSKTLAAWLAERKQAALEEQDYEPGSMMTLDDYDRMGSWLNMSDGRREGKRACGVPGCELHADDIFVHSSQVTNLDFSVPKETFSLGSSPQTHASQLATLSSRVSTSPQSQPRTPMRLTRQRTVSCAPSDGYQSAGIPDRRGMEKSMPGGWTF